MVSESIIIRGEDAKVLRNILERGNSIEYLVSEDGESVELRESD